MKLAQTLSIGRTAAAAVLTTVGAQVATGSAAENAAKALAGDPVAILGALTQLVVAVAGLVGLLKGAPAAGK